MKEASLVKYYFAKYFFLAFGLLQWLCSGLLLLDDNLAAAMLFFALGLVAIILFGIIAPRLKRVSLGNNRIAIISGDETTHYEWPEVKWIRPLPYASVYKLKLRGKKDRIYFLSRQQDVPVFGFTAQEPEWAEAMRRKIK